MTGRNVSIDITNKSKSRFKNESKLRTGKEVVQLYLGFPSIVTGTPPKQLKGFEKISLLPQETKTVVFTLRDRDLSIWDVETHGWKFMLGHSIDIYVGSSSRDIRKTAKMYI